MRKPVRITVRRDLFNTLLFDLKWLIIHAIRRDRKSTWWYWGMAKQTLGYLWKHRYDTSIRELWYE